jgi:hypothetical protein
MEEQNSKYYTPELKEFKQGFKYQICLKKKGDIICSAVYMDGITPRKDYIAKEDKWIDQEVWWDREPSPEFKETIYGDITVYWKECQMDLMPNYSLEIFLQDGRIRAKK